MRVIDADKLYKHIKAECNPYGNPTIIYEDGCKVLDIIKNTEELPTMQSSFICDYCKHKKTPLKIANVGTNICWECGEIHHYCMFKGKEVSGVEE